MSQGILRVVGASLIFGLMTTAAKFVMLSGMSAECNTFYTQLSVCVLAFCVAVGKRKTLKVGWGHVLRLASIGAVGMAITSYLVNSACLYIPAGLATVLHFLYPTIVSIAMVVFFGQKMTGFKTVAILCSVCGMVLIANLGEGSGGKLIGVILALISSLTYSVYMISNERGSSNSLPLIVKLAYSALGGSLFLLVFSLCRHSLVLPATPQAALVQFGVCGLGHMVAFYLLTGGIRHIGASAASFINMLEPITSVVVSSIVYHDDLTAGMIVGIVLVLCSVLMVALDGSRAAALAKDQSGEQGR